MPPSPKYLLKKMWKMTWIKGGSQQTPVQPDEEPSSITGQSESSRTLGPRSYTWNNVGQLPTSPLAATPTHAPSRSTSVESNALENTSTIPGQNTATFQSAAAHISAPASPSPPSVGVKRKDSFVSNTGRMVDSSATSVQMDNNPQIDFLSSLPYEIAVVIVIYADFPAIMNIAEVSKSWRRFARDNAVWRRMFLQQPEWRTPRALAAAGCRSPLKHHSAGSSALASPASMPVSGANTPRIGDTDVMSVFSHRGGPALPEVSARSILSSYTGSSLRPAIALQHMIAPSPSPSQVKEFGGRLVGADWQHLFQQRCMLDRHWEKGVSDVRVVTGHADSVYCVQFDHEKIVTGSRDRTVKVWDSRTLLCMRTLAGHDASVLCLKYDETTLVTGSSDSTIIIWDWESGTPLLRLVSHAAGVLDVAFDDMHIVSCSKDCTIKVWERKTGKLLRTMVGHRGPVNAVQLKGDRIVSASGDSLIKMWDIHTGELIRSFAGHTRGLACVQFDGKTIVSGSSDQLIKVWDAETGRCIKTLSGHKDLVRTLHYTGGRRAVSGSYDQTVKVWDIVTGECVLDLKDVHTSWVFDVQFSTSKIVSTSQDQKIIIWDFVKDLDVADID